MGNLNLISFQNNKQNHFYKIIRLQLFVFGIKHCISLFIQAGAINNLGRFAVIPHRNQAKTPR